MQTCPKYFIMSRYILNSQVSFKIQLFSKLCITRLQQYDFSHQYFHKPYHWCHAFRVWGSSSFCTDLIFALCVHSFLAFSLPLPTRHGWKKSSPGERIRSAHFYPFFFLLEITTTVGLLLMVRNLWNAWYIWAGALLIYTSWNAHRTFLWQQQIDTLHNFVWIHSVCQARTQEFLWGGSQLDNFGPSMMLSRCS